MLYGATGYTGRLLIEEAVKRGHTPIIAGRNEAKIQKLSTEFGLNGMVFPMTHAGIAEDALGQAEVDLVLHAAGPFLQTAAPMREACLRVGAHYLDITGEIPVFEDSFAADAAAKEAGIAVISGVGFDIVPSDCLVKYVHDQLPDATEAAIVVSALSASKDDFGVSAGTLKSLLGMGTSFIRRNGRIHPADLGAMTLEADFPKGTFTAVSIPWGDVSTAYHSTGVPNITAYMTMPLAQVKALRYFGVGFQWMMQFDPVRNAAGRLLDRFVDGPTATTREKSRSYLYVRMTNASGQQAEAWLDLMEGYAFTAIAALNSVERVLAGGITGAQTPSSAFGADFVLEVPTTRRLESLHKA